tara:strand:+ start:106 stop:678 length:573 start_codon:yes stop_codon:yes gene_type:complete
VAHHLLFNARLTISILIVLMMGALLSGCSNVRDALGQNKKSPDEFAILARAPLSMPPNFSLRAPNKGMERPQEPSSRNMGRDLIFKKSNSERGNDSKSNSSSIRGLLGTNKANPKIREIINAETKNMAFEDKPFLDKLLSWKKPSEDGVLVDAAAEAKRLKNNVEQGKPVTEGKTPIIKRKKSGLLNKLF